MVATRLSLCALALLGCSAGDGAEVRSIDVGPFDLESGEETASLCFSYTLENDEALYVSRVAMTADVGFHHSNWLFVPDNVYTGPDGVWECRERNFDTAFAAIAGGVLFAQSTQSQSDLQEFAPGAAVAIPPRSRVVANLHLLNATGDPLAAALSLDVHSIPERDVSVRLAPIYLQYLPLTIGPMQSSRFSTTCNFTEQFEREFDRSLEMKIHYVLPHYHGLGRGVRLEVAGGDRDGVEVFANQSRIGEPLGQRLDPAFDLAGGDGLRFSCDFTNPTESQIGWGIGDQEMCIAFAFAESELAYGGGVMSAEGHRYVGQSDDGVAEHEGDCDIIVSRPK